MSIKLGDISNIYTIEKFEKKFHKIQYGDNNLIVISSQGATAGEIVFSNYHKFDYVIELKDNNFNIIFMKLYLHNNKLILKNFIKGTCIQRIVKNDLSNFEIEKDINQYDYIANTNNYIKKLKSSLINHIENTKRELNINKLVEQCNEINLVNKIFQEHQYNKEILDYTKWYSNTHGKRKYTDTFENNIDDEKEQITTL